MGNGYTISREKADIDIARVFEMLKSSYWAKDRSREAVEQSIENSLCWGVYCGGKQVGFARIVTDHATMYWLCDVIIDEKHRGRGLGKTLMEHVVNSGELAGLRGILATKDAHRLYEQYGFAKVQDRFEVCSSIRKKHTILLPYAGNKASLFLTGSQYTRLLFR